MQAWLEKIIAYKREGNITKSGGVIPTKLDFEMNLRSLMAMAKMMKITNLEKNMLNLRHLPRILNQEVLLKARQAPRFVIFVGIVN